MQLLSALAVAMRSSSVADFYATKYLAKPQPWLAIAFGPLITGFRKVEFEEKQRETIEYEGIVSAENTERHFRIISICLDLLLRSVPLHPDGRICGPNTL